MGVRTVKSQPYREQAEKPASRGPLPRRSAWFRGLYRRVVGPTLFICFVGGIFTLFNVLTCSTTDRRVQIADEEARRHFDGWQAAIDEKQRQADVRTADLDKREQEFKARVQNFDDIVSMSSMLAKNGNDPAPLKEALRRAGVSQSK